MRAMRPAGMPRVVGERARTASTKKWAPTPITATVPTSCATTAQVGAGELEGQRVRFDGRLLLPLPAVALMVRTT